MNKCSYCSKGNHTESSCMKKQIDMLTNLLEKNGISLPESSKKREGGSSSDDRERVHALVAGTSSSPSFIIDSGASRHMVSTKVSSLDMLKGPSIVLGDDSLTESKGKGRIDLDHGKFNNVLYVPGLASNLLSVYQMTRTRSPKKVIFSPDEVEITKISNSRVIAKGVANHAQKYTCSHTSYLTQTPLLF